MRHSRIFSVARGLVERFPPHNCVPAEVSLLWIRSAATHGTAKDAVKEGHMRAPPFPKRWTVVRIPTWLKDCFNDFLASLAPHGFKSETMRAYAHRLCYFGEFVERRGVRDPTQLAGQIESFVRPISPAKKQKQWRSFLTRFAHFAVPPPIAPVEPPSETLDPQVQLVAEYSGFLRDHRGLQPRTIQRIRRTCVELLAFLTDGDCLDLAAVRLERIHQFLVADAKRYSRQGLRSRCGAIRGFLAYLHRRRILTVDLSLAVIAPRVYKHEQCPRFLTRAEVEAVLAAIDRDTPSGKRSYAMLLLLATYGLRGIEVQSLRLDDIDWRNDRFRIAHRKAGNSTDYPLTAVVGEAILDYLKGGRPTSTCRHVFLTAIAPIKPLTRPGPIAYQVRKYLTRVGITVEHPGTHSFRYSCAQRLLESGTPLKAIGDFLGHSHPDSTQRYIKIAIDQLREVAMGNEEDIL
jgi:site-specific recombinase XerD